MNTARFMMPLLLVLTILMSGCNQNSTKNSAEKELQSMVDDLNRACPIHFDDSNVSLTGGELRDSWLVLNYEYNNSSIDIDNLAQQPDFAEKVVAYMLLREPTTEKIATTLIDAGYGFKLVFKNPILRKKTELALSNEALKEIRKRPVSKADMLKWQIETMKAMLPQTVDETTEMTDIKEDAKAVTLIYSADEMLVDIDVIAANKHIIADDMRSYLSNASVTPSSSMEPFLKLLRRTGKDLRCVYKGKTSGKSVTIEFSNKELRDMANDYVSEE